jgi:hypothetical protein
MKTALNKTPVVSLLLFSVLDYGAQPALLFANRGGFRYHYETGMSGLHVIILKET